MDNHFGQVTQLRAKERGGPPRLYFAYSTVLDRAAFEQWRAEHGYTAFNLPAGEKAEALDVSLVFDFPSRWWGGRVAGLCDQANARVHGLLFEIAAEDWPIVQHKEGAVTGMSIERKVPVQTSKGMFTATAFTTHPDRASRDGAISERFMEALERGARNAGLPESYVQGLRGLAR